MSSRESMRALVLRRFGSTLEASTLPRPVPRPGEVLVRIYASGMNPLDLKIMGGNAAHAEVQPPAVLTPGARSCGTGWASSRPRGGTYERSSIGRRSRRRRRWS